MELIERINSLEKEIKVLKGEIKSILVDLRESMNLLENPFASIEHLKAVSGKGGGIDEDILNRICGMHLQQNLRRVAKEELGDVVVNIYILAFNK